MPRPADPNAKDALVAAARKEFVRRGLVGARIEDITAACGLSKGAFYLHFESKEALFGELVKEFFGVLTECSDSRHDEMAAFFEANGGGPTRRDVEQRTPRYQKFLELETTEDLRVLEHMWAYRDVMDVLVRGAAGTKFEGAIWQITDREVERIQENVDRFQGAHACRSDIPSEIFGSMIVGTYMLLAMRMSRMTEKPDLAGWARSLHVLIREGSAPVDHSPTQKNMQKKPAPPKSRKVHPRSVS
jgi:AcrR family transcriptional regulator